MRETKRRRVRRVGVRSFQHEPLTDNRGIIRLLRILPGTTETIECELTADALNTYPSYCAISYTWGPPTPTRTLMVNGRPLTVRLNCWYALKQVQTRQRRENTSHPVWIDSVCIDQDNNLEKSGQVQLMHLIYTLADYVAVCLGQREDAIVRLFDIAFLATSGSVDSSKQLAQEVLTDGVTTLAHCSYFTRLWIVQEFRHASAIVLFCGDSTMQLSELRKAPGFLDEVRREGGILSQLLLNPVNRHGPWDVLHRYRNAECSEPRDKVYALLAIVKFQWISVDYDIPLIELLFGIYDELRDPVDWNKFFHTNRGLAQAFGLTSDNQNVKSFRQIRESSAEIYRWPSFPVAVADVAHIADIRKGSRQARRDLADQGYIAASGLVESEDHIVTVGVKDDAGLAEDSAPVLHYIVCRHTWEDKIAEETQYYTIVGTAAPINTPGTDVTQIDAGHCDLFLRGSAERRSKEDGFGVGLRLNKVDLLAITLPGPPSVRHLDLPVTRTRSQLFITNKLQDPRNARSRVSSSPEV